MEILVDENSSGNRIDTFLAKYLNQNRTKIAKCIDEKIIKLNNKETKSSYKLKINDKIQWEENRLNSFLNPDLALKPYKFELDIKYEDDFLIVINKPKSILTHPTKFENERTIANALLYHCDKLSDLSGADRPGIVHRLDKNTAGLMITAKNNEVHKILSEQIKSKTLKRKYLAIALGKFKGKEGVINKPLLHYLKDNVKMTIAKENQGLEAITKYKVLEEFKGANLVELELKTGRTHQIRVHLASQNTPVFGDNLYGAKSFMQKEFYNLKTQEQLLQSYYLSFIHPKTSEKLEFTLEEKDFSEDFIKVLNFLRRNNNVD